ncbi:hypothetical protein CQA49_01380 [Helicobacter sp. MIT 00-7814]|uniref:hypothetical protein n=1 Tax=unclassified Helicobacter TaxID=2593540 RepID=UPI000E1F51AD|nr:MULTISPECIES: hypothetical protein [unclassified Helicobacter]RDU53276.1 hypothetical protein CQA37_07105 [Helicobacter sp. MIT 99-10781]RDU56971.1 hypothetical protein CQA49_01380 [Helicobacter sp. MIT 00-7814]
MESLILPALIVIIWLSYRYFKKRKMVKLIKQKYPNKELVERIVKKHALDFSTDSDNEILASKNLEKAFLYWAENDLKRARDCFQRTAQITAQDDIPQYKSEIVTKIITEFTEYDDLFHDIIRDTQNILDKNPNILQTDIYAHLKEYSKRDIQYALYYADVKNLISRVKKNRSYILNNKDSNND